MGLRSFFRSIRRRNSGKYERQQQKRKSHRYRKEREGNYPILSQATEESTAGFRNVVTVVDLNSENDASSLRQTSPLSSTLRSTPSQTHNSNNSNNKSRWKRLPDESFVHYEKENQVFDVDKLTASPEHKSKFKRIFRQRKQKPNKSNKAFKKNYGKPSLSKPAEEANPYTSFEPTPYRALIATTSSDSKSPSESEIEVSPVYSSSVWQEPATPKGRLDIVQEDDAREPNRASPGDTSTTLTLFLNESDPEDDSIAHSSPPQEATHIVPAAVQPSQTEEEIIFSHNSNEIEVHAKVEREAPTDASGSKPPTFNPTDAQHSHSHSHSHPFHKQTTPTQETSPIAPRRILFATDDVQEKTDEVKTNHKKPPLAEVAGHRRAVSNDFSDISGLSNISSSMSSAGPLEFSLETGFKANKAARMLAVSENIVQSLQRKETRDQEAQALSINGFWVDANGDRLVGPEKEEVQLRKCLVLIMDPRRRIFEIVQVPYRPKSTTVGEVLDNLPLWATDKRLARMHFSGLVQEDLHVSAADVLLEMLLEASKDRPWPIFAIPTSYQADEIMELGDSLLQSPNVARLLRDQWSKVHAQVTRDHEPIGEQVYNV